MRRRARRSCATSSSTWRAPWWSRRAYPSPHRSRSAARVESGTLPAGRYASTTHVGHPDGLYDATVGLLTWAGNEGLPFDKHPSADGEVWANRVEWYQTNPMKQPDMDQWVTRLTFKLAD